MRILKAGALYFAFVFGAGFVLGIIRTLWLVPELGTRTAELMEMPVMLIIIIASARWIIQRLAVPPGPSNRLAMGGLALTLVLMTEFTLVLGLRGITLHEYFATRDPVSGSVYYALLGVFAVMPLLLALHDARAAGSARTGSTKSSRSPD